jgi:hypothetical protein
LDPENWKPENQNPENRNPENRFLVKLVSGFGQNG